MDDTEFLRAFLRGWPAEEKFHHYDHLRIAWIVIEASNAHWHPLPVWGEGSGVRGMKRDDDALLDPADRARA